MASEAPSNLHLPKNVNISKTKPQNFVAFKIGSTIFRRSVTLNFVLKYKPCLGRNEKEDVKTYYIIHLSLATMITLNEIARPDVASIHDPIMQRLALSP